MARPRLADRWPFDVAGIFLCAAIGDTPALADSVAFTASSGLVQGDALRNVCGTSNPSFTTDDLSGITSPCATAPGSVLIEMLYFRNASRVGGTALAAYPLVRIQTGIVRNLEFVLDTPSQVAMSGEAGAGPTDDACRLRIELRLCVECAFGRVVRHGTRSAEFALRRGSVAIEISAYRILRVPHRSPHHAHRQRHRNLVARSRFNRIKPAATVRLAYDLSPKTQLSGDFGARIVTRGTVAQSYGDVAINQRLHKDVTFAVGLGTTFNSVSNQRHTTLQAASTSNCGKSTTNIFVKILALARYLCETP